jgi:Sec-independent protein secretion pathway component TatC
MRIKEYMREMYIRILYILFSVIITCICAYASASQLIYILAAPLEEAHNARNEIFNMTGELKEASFGEEFHFIFTEITEAFMAATQLSMFMGLYMQWPIILYQLWLFIKPGLYQYESKGALATMIIACGLSGINVIMTY